MSNFTTDGQICIDREIEVTHTGEDFGELIRSFDIIETCKWITENSYSRVCLQFPDDLLGASARIYEEIKNRVDVDLYILGDTSYASCCIDSVAAMHVNSDAVVHYGHTCFSKTNIPVLTVLLKTDLNVEASMKVLCDKFASDHEVRLCLFYDAAFEHCKDIIAKYWYQRYPCSYIAFVEIDDQQERFLGRVLKNASGELLTVDTLKDCVCVYVGSRGQTVFNYTISIAEWYLLDPSSSTLERMEETVWFKRRRFLVEKCKDANVVGILICKLAGDQTQDIISRMKQLCRINGKKSYIVSVGKPNVAKLANFPEVIDFYKPLVYPYELEVALNSKREPYITTHVTDFDELLPGKRHHCDIARVKEETDVSLITGKIRETKIDAFQGESTDLVAKQNWALENIGQSLQDRSWKGLEQKLGETEVKNAEEGRKGIPIQLRLVPGVMALVAYDNSDCSDYEDEDNENTPIVELITKPEKAALPIEVPSTIETEETTIEIPTLFNLLPQPSTTKQVVVEEDDEFLHKKATADVVKPKAKITVPSLSEVRSFLTLITKLNYKLSPTHYLYEVFILPQPRNGLFTGSSKSLIPNILTQKPNNVKKTALPSPLKKLKPDSKTLATEYSDESDDDLQNDFFSFNKPVELPEPIELPLDVPNMKPTEPKMSKLESYFKKDVVENHVELLPDEESYSQYADSEAGSSYSNEAEAESSNNGMVLDEEAILKLCGSRGKRRREDIHIVDVDQKEVLADAQQWLLKGLMDDTSKRVSSSKKRGNEPTNMQKRKHQITYLAHQAKANEVELQNQWANNRTLKRKTQSKYGF
ncbi:Diphteria toxin resistance protein 2, dph2 [Operophtera brumata]|uniref:2-(3-amino-3-carboxypropyl)histidine synthase subunit 2 n=1 Tax=Operophtera brumata TaxID=104452 RepID=A0A0L7L2R3_OPEBR|nr:Diphteria toxin resistance protein 2, dph2 [Operophtera brumata]